MTNNPNFTNKANGSDAAEPFRLDRSQAFTADQNHAYTAEQQAYDGGKADLFPKFTGKATSGGAGAFGTKGQVMGYYDGNTVAAMWNYAQHFAMSDNAFGDTYGPSTPGMLNISSGQTNGMTIVATTKQPSTVAAVSYYINDGQGGLTMINDVDPGYDVCSNPKDQAMMSGKTIGDLLNGAGITWGSFMGGFRLDADQRQRLDRLQTLDAFDRRRRRCRGLHPASRLVSVLRLDRQSETRAAEFARRDRL